MTATSVAVNSFLAAGQDGFTAFRNGTNYVTGPVDVDVLEDYFATRYALGQAVRPPSATHGTPVLGTPAK